MLSIETALELNAATSQKSQKLAFEGDTVNNPSRNSSRSNTPNQRPPWRTGLSASFTGRPGSPPRPIAARASPPTGIRTYLPTMALRDTGSSRTPGSSLPPVPRSSRSATPTGLSMTSGQSRNSSQWGSRSSSPLQSQLLSGDAYEIAKKLHKLKENERKMRMQVKDGGVTNLENAEDVSAAKTTMTTTQSEEEVTKERKDGDGDGDADDWKECYDPRSKRHFFYSPKLHKSCWRLPSAADRANRGQPASRGSYPLPSSSRSASRAASPSAISLRSYSPLGSRLNETANLSQYYQQNRLERDQQKEQAEIESLWVSAIDPQTQKRYYYNRQTHVSTWRKPAELII